MTTTAAAGPRGQGTDKESTGRQRRDAPPGVVTVGELPRYDRSAWLRARIVGLIDAGGTWRQPAGAESLWSIRQRVGGRVGTPEFRRAVEELLAAGTLIEAWLQPSGAKEPGHVLLIPGRSDALKSPVVKARGRLEVMDREPWYAEIAAG